MVLIANQLEEKKAVGAAAGGPLDCYDLNVEGYGPHPSQGGGENVFSMECVLYGMCSTRSREYSLENTFYRERIL
jgi:hypothetical protein